MWHMLCLASDCFKSKPWGNINFVFYEYSVYWLNLIFFSKFSDLAYMVKWLSDILFFPKNECEICHIWLLNTSKVSLGATQILFFMNIQYIDMILYFFQNFQTLPTWSNDCLICCFFQKRMWNLPYLPFKYFKSKPRGNTNFVSHENILSWHHLVIFWKFSHHAHMVKWMSEILYLKNKSHFSCLY